MSLILGIGSNLGDRLQNLENAKNKLKIEFGNFQESRVVESLAVDYTEQPDFLNQVIEFSLPQMNPLSVLNKILRIERELGRKRDIPKGPRTIDIDILYWHFLCLKHPSLEIPHPHIRQRSFVCIPMRDLSSYKRYQNYFSLPDQFPNNCQILS